VLRVIALAGPSSMHDAARVVRWMEAEGVQPTERLYLMLLDVATRASRASPAIGVGLGRALLADMRAAGLPVSFVHCEAAIRLVAAVAERARTAARGRGLMRRAPQLDPFAGPASPLRLGSLLAPRDQSAPGVTAGSCLSPAAAGASAAWLTPPDASVGAPLARALPGDAAAESLAVLHEVEGLLLEQWSPALLQNASAPLLNASRVAADSAAAGARDKEERAAAKPGAAPGADDDEMDISDGGSGCRHDAAAREEGAAGLDGRLVGASKLLLLLSLDAVSSAAAFPLFWPGADEGGGPRRDAHAHLQRTDAD